MARDRLTLLLLEMDTVFEKEQWHKGLLHVLSGLSAAQASKVPARAAHTVWQLVNHLVFWKEDVVHQFERTGQVEPESNDATFLADQTADEEAWRRTLDRLKGAQTAIKARLSQLDDASLDRPMPGQSGSALQAVIVGLITHDSYHAGQIVDVRRAIGAWPVSRKP